MRSARIALLLAGVLGAVPAAAQSSFERVAASTVLGFDFFAGENVSSQPQVIVDIIGTMRLAGGWAIYARPWFRQPRPTAPGSQTPPWDTELYQAAIRYERTGEISTRVEAGYIASPIGLGVFDTTPSANPTVAGHMSYFVPMRPFDAGGPRVSAVTATYPLGAVVALSTRRWDARAALVNSAPTRAYVIGGTANPRATPVVEAGAGITPRVGLRFGVSLAHGAYLTPEELSPSAVPGDRDVTIVGAEGEYAIGYTKLAGELIRDAFSTPAGTRVAYTWFVQGTRTLAPRWFMAARQEGTSSPVAGITVTPAQRAQPDLKAAEIAIGFRATPDVTLRTSYYVRQNYGRQHWDNQIGMAMVWARRWW